MIYAEAAERTVVVRVINTPISQTLSRPSTAMSITPRQLEGAVEKEIQLSRIDGDVYCRASLTTVNSLY